MENFEPWIRLHPDDNVVVLTQSIQAGTLIHVGGRQLEIENNLGLGHKLACMEIKTGDVILKYGVPIGTAIKPIQVGEWVHTHNIKSNYIPTYLIEDERR